MLLAFYSVVVDTRVFQQDGVLCTGSIHLSDDGVRSHPAAQLLIQSVDYGVDAGACLSGVNR